MANVDNSVLDLIASTYATQFQNKGTTHEGVLWASKNDQIKRFKTLLSPVETSFQGDNISINDLGCGYGAFFDFLKSHPALTNGRFYGYDLCADFIHSACKIHSDPRASFMVARQAKHSADYSFASGTFNFMGPQSEEEWAFYVKDSLRQYFKKTKIALVFNLLNSNEANKQEWLYYCDPQEYVEFCAKALSRKTKLLLNPELNGFTICVWK